MWGRWSLLDKHQSSSKANMPPSVVATVSEALIAGQSAKMAIEETIKSGFQDLEALQRLVGELSRSPLLPLARIAYARLESREWLLNAQRILAGPGLLVDRRWPITSEQFQKDYYFANRPVFLPGAANDWPAVNKWTKEYLIATAGSAKVDVMIGRDGVPAHLRAATDHLKQTISFEHFVERCWQHTTNDFYLVGVNDFFSKEGTDLLARDVGDLPFLRTECTNGAVKLWVGPAGTLTHFHYDGRNNVMIQVVGEKRVTLIPPNASEFMRQMLVWYAGSDPLENGDGLAPNHATVVLAPGDALFIPVGWWHRVEAMTTTVTLTCTNFGLPNSYEKPPVTLVPRDVSL